VLIVPDVEVHLGARGDTVEMSDSKCKTLQCYDHVSGTRSAYG